MSVENQFAMELKTEGSNEAFKRVKVFYVKNGKEQNAVYMNYGKNGEKNYKIVEDNYYAHNRLSEHERMVMGEELNNGFITLYAEAM